ncbi:MAG: nuclear transport factor 2 family protein [Pedobacter sp.]|uniref:nuclear transport factor 2 family protein n=1 Tax=Pedobacter sp. TaxID=1411316 RepID=UPI0033946234
METAVVNTKEFILSLIEAFDNNDVESILEHLSDDIEWTIIGHETLSGKNNIEEFFKAHPDMKMLSSTKDHMIIDGDSVAVNGEVDCVNESTGNRQDMFYCDIYDLKDGKVQRMTSYCVDKKQPEQEF